MHHEGVRRPAERRRLAALTILGLFAAGAATAAEEGEPVGDPDFPWLHNAFYKIHLDVRGRVSLADIDGDENSEAVTLRTRLGLEAMPYFGFSALAELENTYSPNSGDYRDGRSPPDGQSLIADPENTELNRLWGRYQSDAFLGQPVSLMVKGGKQRIVHDNARFIGNVVWRQNEQTFDAARGQTNLFLEDFLAEYAYLWTIQRIFGDSDFAPDFDSESHLARVEYTGIEDVSLIAFTYFLDFEGDSPSDSSNSYGFRVVGFTELDQDLALEWIGSYAYQTDARDNPVDYDAHYVWISLDLKNEPLGSIQVGYEMLGSDDGDARFVTPLSTAHKFNGFADAFLDNGGPRGLQNLFLSVSPDLPWKLKGSLIYHEFWRADGGGHLGREIDGLLTRAFNEHLYGLFKAAYFDGTSQGPADRWRLTFEINFSY